MGLDSKALLVVGVQVKDICQIRTITTPIKKYNPDTGEPYETTVSKKVVFLFGKETDFDPCPHEWDISKFDKVDLYYSDSESNWESYVLGIRIAKAEGIGGSRDKMIVDVPMDIIETAKKQVKDSLEPHGFIGEPKIFLISYVSY